MSSTYICVECKGEFDKGWSDEEALEEKGRLFSDIPVDKCDLVCDDCFKEVMNGRKDLELIQVSDKDCDALGVFPMGSSHYMFGVPERTKRQSLDWEIDAMYSIAIKDNEQA